MSRYFTSPPTVYARNWANGQNLVELTKIERQVVASKKVLLKEKEKNKQKNEKKSLKLQYFPPKQVSDESDEQLERSCVTEGHDQHHLVGYLSDGSQSSKKRVGEASLAVESNVKDTAIAGNPLRIRFVFKKSKEAEVKPQEDRVCSTSGIERPSEISTSVSGSETCNYDEKVLSASLPSESKKRKKHKPSKESRYNTLFDEWVPPCISLEEDNSNSNDWHFGSRQLENASSKTSIKNDEYMIMNFQTSGGCSSLLRAQFLSDVGIFSLPYTVPL